MLQLHLSGQQSYCLLGGVFYQMFYRTGKYVCHIYPRGEKVWKNFVSFLQSERSIDRPWRLNGNPADANVSRCRREVIAFPLKRAVVPSQKKIEPTSQACRYLYVMIVIWSYHSLRYMIISCIGQNWQNWIHSKVYSVLSCAKKRNIRPPKR